MNFSAFKYFILVFLLFKFMPGSSQTWLWGFNGPNYTTGRTCAFDCEGNFYIAGSGTIESSLVQKYNLQGKLIWTRDIFGVGALDIAVNNDTILFAVGNGYKGEESFITKLDSSGIVRWTKKMSTGGYQTHVARSVASDKAGNCYATGVFESNANYGGCSFTNTSQGLFYVQLDHAGSCLWSHSSDGTYWSYLTVDRNDALIYTDYGSLAKVANGVVQWSLTVHEMKGNWPPTISEVHTDSLNNIYFVTGGDSLQIGASTIKLDPNKSLLVKLSPDGSVIWAKQHQFPSTRFAVSDHLYFAGSSIIKYTLDGDLVWNKTFTDGDVWYYDVAKYNNFLGVTGTLNGVLMNGNDTILKSFGSAAIAAILNEDGIVGVPDVMARIQLSVYPNPASTAIRFESEYAPFVLKIYDCSGNLIKTALRLSGSVDIDVSDMEKGLYFFQLTCEQGTTTRKIVVE